MGKALRLKEKNGGEVTVISTEGFEIQVTCELLAAGCKIADQAGEELAAVLFGKNVAVMVDTLGDTVQIRFTWLTTINWASLQPTLTAGCWQKLI